MHSRHLGASVGRLLLLQPFMEPFTEVGTNANLLWKFHRHELCWPCGRISAVSWKGLAFIFLAFLLNYGAFRRKEGAEVRLKGEKEWVL